MSDLQISLLVIGAFVVAGVYLFNAWQERQLRRRAEQAFAPEHDDVLLQDTAAREEIPAGRIEPKRQVAAPMAPLPIRAPVRAPVVTVVDPVIDYVVEVSIPDAADGAGLHEELSALAAGWGKPVQVAGYDPASGEWQAAGIRGGARFPQWRFALQMTNRAGCVEQDRLTAFRDAVLRWAERSQGTAKCLDIAEAHAMAVQLDRFCADVDIAIGINVIAHDGNPFSGTKIRALAEAAGLKLEPDGVFYLCGDHGDTLFTLDNHEPMPFMPDQMKTLFTSGVTFLLDVPRVEHALHAFDAMLGMARNFVTALDGMLVDDNRSALSDTAIATIRRQLDSILAKMEAGQIAAGGARALRLFS
jgi:FtsZ-interacting cell division protein ZipA